MTDKQPNFAERRQLLEHAARDLAAIADIIADEAERMAAAEQRFAERRGETKRKASR